MRPTPPHGIDPALLLEHTDWVRDLARSLVSPQHAEDVAQEAILIALASPPRVIESRLGLRAWLARVVRNLGYAAARSDSRRRTREAEVAKHESQPSVAETVSRASRLQAVVDEVMRLDEPYRDAVLLRYFERLGAKEIAAVTGTTPAAARVRVSRGLDHLRARLAADEEEGRTWLAGLAGFGLGDARKNVAAGSAAPTVKVALLLGLGVLGMSSLSTLLLRTDVPGDSPRDAGVVVARSEEERSESPPGRLEPDRAPSRPSAARPATEDPMNLAAHTPPALVDRPRPNARSFVGTLAATFALSGSATAQWSTDDLQTARRQLSAVSVGDEAVFAGGRISVWSKVVEIYDDSTGLWSQAELSSKRGHMAATSVGNYALFAGGRTGSMWNVSDVVDIYDASTSTWSTHTLSEARAYFTATTVGTKAMFAGGTFDSGFTTHSDVVDIYDAAIGPPTDPNAWSTATLSVPRVYLSATTVGQYALFAGGAPDLGQTSLDTVDIYDDSTGTWSAHTLSLPRYDLAAASVGNKAFFAGGMECCLGNTEVDVVDIYDSSVGPPTDANAWSTAPLSQARTRLSAVSLGALVLFAGGSGVPNGPMSEVVDIYDDAAGTWSTWYLSDARSVMASTAVGEKAIFAGGTDNSLSASGVVDIYDLDFGERYCSPATTNSTGLPGVTLAYGQTAAFANNISLVAEQLPPNQFGYFLNSQTQASTFPVPNSQGVLCVGGAIGRYNGSVFNTGSAGTGSLILDLHNTPTPSGSVVVQAGETWNFTAWYRDLNPNATSNFTDGVSIEFQ